MLRDNTPGTNLFGWGEHGVEDAIDFFELIIVVVDTIVVWVQGHVQ
jgi:hypothetical protein